MDEEIMKVFDINKNERLSRVYKDGFGITRI